MATELTPPASNTVMAPQDNAEDKMEAYKAYMTELATKRRSEYTWHDIEQIFRESMEDEALDIYQVCGWISKNEDVSFMKKVYFYFKGVVCAFIQTVGLVIFLYIQCHTILTDLGFCAMRSEDDGVEHATLTQILSVLFAVYIALKMGGFIVELGNKGLYNMDFFNPINCPPYISRNWILLGGYVNIFAALFASLGSFIVLYISDDILDVILNSVALFFVLDVDDYMLDSLDYQRIEDWFQQKYDASKYKDWHPAPIGKCFKAFITIASVLSFSAVGVGVAAAMLAPIWIAVCH